MTLVLARSDEKHSRLPGLLEMTGWKRRAKGVIARRMNWLELSSCTCDVAYDSAECKPLLGTFAYGADEPFDDQDARVGSNPFQIINGKK